MKCRCKHFTGIQNKTCDQGVTYNLVRHTSGWPCLTGDVDTCVRRELMTPDEFAAEEAETDKAVSNVLEARLAVVAAVASGCVKGQIECPICAAGELSFAMADNGHIRASCSTPDCVRWIE